MNALGNLAFEIEKSIRVLDSYITPESSRSDLKSLVQARVQLDRARVLLFQLNASFREHDYRRAVFGLRTVRDYVLCARYTLARTEVFGPTIVEE